MYVVFACEADLHVLWHVKYENLQDYEDDDEDSDEEEDEVSDEEEEDNSVKSY